ncbi:alpha/beta fold hydrolase [Marivita hallyeonensis]|uniref:Pimeloyl-ACP methyl ester carboxylesterase n=1 Tax=Marivita hallyeonensis TaxID=996342 RepID=A0A1M5NGH0_9RHOB|nr:alpha/beta hydrolase [Marivita hallyeonensis]SHG88557.1 Pimeloyl-ACP methyl ester carboxylesterase [Marivita hallyeonensis]
MPTFPTSDGLSLHYTDEGDGLPLVCLAGLTRDGRDFDFVAPHLSNVRLIRLDYRGRGQSDWADPSTYHIPVEGRDAVELMDHLGLEKAAILGTSRGGLIAMVMASVVKDRMLGVALNDIGPEIAPEGLEVIKDYLGRTPALRSHAEVAEARERVMTGFANVPKSRWMEEAQRLFHETEDGLALTYDPKLRDAVLNSGAEPAPDAWPLFDALAGLPLACIRGANSDLLAKSTFEEMKTRRPDMIAADVPDRGHIPFLDEPESLDALRRWLDMLR